MTIIQYITYLGFNVTIPLNLIFLRRRRSFKNDVMPILSEKVWWFEQFIPRSLGKIIKSLINTHNIFLFISRWRRGLSFFHRLEWKLLKGIFLGTCLVASHAENCETISRAKCCLGKMMLQNYNMKYNVWILSINNEDPSQPVPV